MIELRYPTTPNDGLQSLLHRAWANYVLLEQRKENDEIVAGLPRSRWQQFDREKDYHE